VAETADAIVIGAGILGVGTAYQLRQRDFGRIVVLERDAVCSGSTALASGGIRLQWSHPLGINLVRKSLATFENFEDEFGVDLPLNRCGYLYLARTEAQLDTYRRNVALQQSLGVDVELLSGDEVARLFPYLETRDVLGATYRPGDCQADPYLATTAMAARARDLGVEIKTGYEVLAIRRDDQRVIGVSTTRGDFDAPVVVIAAGPWSGLVGRLAGIDVPVRPRRRDKFVTAPFSPERVPASTPFITDFGAGFSIRREGRGMIIGQTPRESPDDPVSFGTAPDWSALPNLVERAVHRCPALADAEIATAFGGLLEATPDRQGIVDAVAGVEGLYLITGFSGHGFMQGPAAATLLAELITVGQMSMPEASALRFSRFETGDLTTETLVSLN
jgi:sarcosine oxidase subunit beta